MPGDCSWLLPSWALPSTKVSRKVDIAFEMLRIQSLPLIAAQAVECYECGETSEMGSCSEFSMTQDFVKTCSGNFQSCVSTVASFGDTIGEC